MDIIPHSLPRTQLPCSNQFVDTKLDDPFFAEVHIPWTFTTPLSKLYGHFNFLSKFFCTVIVEHGGFEYNYINLCCHVVKLLFTGSF